jgi:REP element-mobilizing transposase RayT
MHRAWLLTWTAYGTWLPGDSRGSVTRVRDCRADGTPRSEHDQFETPYLAEAPGLAFASRAAMKGSSTRLTREQALVVAEDFEATAKYRNWAMPAGSVMANHVHLVVIALETTRSEKLLQILKSYASRALNRRWELPTGSEWWTASGSRRPLRDDDAIESASRYVRGQEYRLAECREIRSQS